MQYMFKLTEDELSLLLSDFMPLGRVPKYDINSNSISLTDTTTRRFIFDGTHTKKFIKSNKLSIQGKFDPYYLGFGLLETLSIIIQKDYVLYQKLYNFFDNVDKMVSTLSPSCSQSIVIFSHNSFGERLFPHIHQDNDNNKPTLSVFFNMTGNDSKLPKLVLTDDLDTDSKFFKKGYTNHLLLLSHERKSTNTTEIEINNGDMILFDAYKIPHSFTYTNDLWVTIVYDHVTVNNINVINKGRYSVCALKK